MGRTVGWLDWEGGTDSTLRDLPNRNLVEAIGIHPFNPGCGAAARVILTSLALDLGADRPRRYLLSNSYYWGMVSACTRVTLMARNSTGTGAT